MSPPRGPPLLVLAVVGSAFAAGVRLLLRRRPCLPRHPTVAHTHGSVLCALDLAPGPHPGPPAPPLPLAGLRFAVKDNFDVQGTVTGFGSPCWAQTHGAAETHAQAVAACLAAGARGTCKVVMDELAFSISGRNAHYGTPVNPCAPKHVPGGSSSGSAVACASGLVDFALGTDTGGSVRVPAAHCALFGMRPTHGAVSLEGVVPLAPSLDTVGWFARDAATFRAVGAALLPPGGVNGCQVPVAADAVRCFAVAEDCLRGVSDDAMAGVAALLQAADVSCPEANASRLDVGAYLLASCPALLHFQSGAFTPTPDAASSADGCQGLQAARTALRVLQGAEVWAAHGQWVATAQPQLAPDVRGRIDAAACVTPQAAAAAQAARTQARAALDGVFAHGTVLVLPTVPAAPPLCSAQPDAMDSWRNGCMTLLSIAGLGGVPQVHLPLGVDQEGLPVGVSLIGPRGGDHALLALTQTLAGAAAEAFTAGQAEKREFAAAAAAQAAAAACEKPRAASSKAHRAHRHAHPAEGGSAPAWDALKLKGNAAFKAGNYAEAASFYSQGLDKAPRNAVLRANRAMAYLKTGEFKAAEEDCTACLQLDGRNVKALLRRGTARAFLGELHTAYEDFEAVLVLEPNNKDARAEVERLRRLAGGGAQDTCA